MIRPMIVGIALVGVVLPAIAQKVTLITAVEAALPPAAGTLATRGISRGPSVKQLSPATDSPVKGPVDLKFSFEGRGGEKIDPIIILKITDKNGVVLREFSPTAKAVMKPETAYLMTFMLQGAVREPGGTAEGLNRSFIAAGNEIGAKTGTTSNFSDGWFMGVTQKLVTGVWVGGDDRSIHFRNIQLGQGAKMAMPAFTKFMEKVYSDRSLALDGYQKMPFIKPENIAFDFSCVGGIGGDSTLTSSTATALPE